MRRNMRRSGGPSGGVNQGAIESCPFRAVVSLAASTSPFTINVGALDLTIAGIGGRAASLATNFEKWRLRTLKLYGFTNCSGNSFTTNAGLPESTGIAHAIAYSPIGASDFKISPSTFEALSQLDCFAFTQGYLKNRLNIPKRLLKPKLETKWLRTSTTDAPSYDTTTNGSVWFLFDSDIGMTSVYNPVLFVVVEGVIEFTTQILAVDQLILPHLATLDHERDEDSEDEKIVVVKPKKKG